MYESLVDPELPPPDLPQVLERMAQLDTLLLELPEKRESVPLERLIVTQRAMCSIYLSEFLPEECRKKTIEIEAEEAHHEDDEAAQQVIQAGDADVEAIIKTGEFVQKLEKMHVLDIVSACVDGSPIQKGNGK
jgi:hypothetical protein